MNFDELILKRQSDRKYLPDAVAKEDIMKCLEAARMSPSACNSQPWKFVVVDDRAKLVEMAEQQQKEIQQMNEVLENMQNEMEEVQQFSADDFDFM